MDENELIREPRKRRIMNWTLGVALVAIILLLAVWVVQLIGTKVN